MAGNLGLAALGYVGSLSVGQTAAVVGGIVAINTAGSAIVTGYATYYVVKKTCEIGIEGGRYLVDRVSQARDNTLNSDLLKSETITIDDDMEFEVLTHVPFILSPTQIKQFVSPE